MKNTFKFLIIFLATMFNVAYAETELNFAKTVQNPLAVNPEARYYNLPFVGYINFDYGAHNNTQDILELKPVTPFSFTQSYDLIFRTIIPFEHQPSSQGYTNGLGDINITAFFTPTKNNWFIYGVGPTFTFPTANPTTLGAGKWSMGPEIVLIAMPNQWTFALLTDNIWSYAGQNNRPAVNQFNFQYFVTYNFKRGWYLTTQPNIIANWPERASQIWTVPVGGGVGRVFHVGKQGMNILMQGYYDPIRPTNAAQWTLQMTVDFLFPDERTA